MDMFSFQLVIVRQSLNADERSVTLPILRDNPLRAFKPGFLAQLTQLSSGLAQREDLLR